MHTDHLVGLPLATGLARGRARVLGGEPQEAGSGAVLVLSRFDSALVPAVANAAALVLDASHQQTSAAIVARELGIPAVVLKDALSRITDGTCAEVDGTAGTVRVR